MAVDEPLDSSGATIIVDGHARPELRLHEVDEAAARLQRRDVGIEIHPVDGFQLEGHVIR